MHFTTNLPKFIVIPVALILVVIFVMVFSVFFVILLIPLAIAAFRFWRSVKVAQKASYGDVIEAQYTVIENSDED
jgi:uncharacterized membrane protein